jgi:hypothetical protein
VHVANHTDQVVRQSVLEQISHCASRDCPVDVFIPVVHRQHHDSRIWLPAPDCVNGLHAVHGRHFEVHQRHVGSMPDELLDRLFAVAGLGHDGHVGLNANNAGDPLPHQPMIIDAQNSNRARH